jgi:hypothetical protein
MTSVYQVLARFGGHIRKSGGQALGTKLHLLQALLRHPHLGRVLRRCNCGLMQAKPFLHPTEVVYSWDHPSGEFSSRIDMIWAPTLLQQSIDDCNYHPSFFSDHRYILLSFNTGDIFSSRSGGYCSLVRSFCTFWKTQKDPSLVSLLDWWDKGKFYLRKVTRGFARARPAEQAHQNRALNKQLKQLQRLFDAGDSSAFAGLCSIQEKLRAIHLHEARYSPVGARCRWEEEGETSSAFFRTLEKKHRTKQLVSSIRDPDSGPIYHDPFDILGTWRRYYTKLSTAEVFNVAAHDDVLSQLTRTLSKAEAESFEGLLAIQECKRALDAMSRGKTPGSDGFPCNFIYPSGLYL